MRKLVGLVTACLRAVILLIVAICGMLIALLALWLWAMKDVDLEDVYA